MGVVCLNLDLDDVAVLRRVLAGALLTIQPPTGNHDQHPQLASPDIQTIYAMIADLDRLLGRPRSARRRVLAPISLPDGAPPGPRLHRGEAPVS